MLLVADGLIVYLFIERIGDTRFYIRVLMFVCIWLFILKLDLLGISGNQPQAQFVISPRKIVMGKFKP